MNFVFVSSAPRVTSRGLEQLRVAYRQQNSGSATQHSSAVHTAQIAAVESSNEKFREWPHFFTFFTSFHMWAVSVLSPSVFACWCFEQEKYDPSSEILNDSQSVGPCSIEYRVTRILFSYLLPTSVESTNMVNQRLIFLVCLASITLLSFGK